MGLVVFQSTALALSPLTLDHDALRRAVEEVRSGLLPDGTAIGLGLAEALNLLRDSPARSRVIVLLTDGQNNKGAISPLEAAQLADVLGVRVYTIGFVSPVSAPTVDEATLRAVAELTGAAYYDAATRQELAAAYAAIGALERSRVGERRFTTFREFAPWLAGAALMVVRSSRASPSRFTRMNFSSLRSTGGFSQRRSRSGSGAVAAGVLWSTASIIPAPR